MITPLTAPYTAEELRNEIVLAECVIRTGHWNGYPLNGDDEDHWKARLLALRGDLAAMLTEDDTVVSETREAA
jgi:hypothetical protein